MGKPAQKPKPIFPELPCTVRTYFERRAWEHTLWRHRGFSQGVKLIGTALADHLSMDTAQLNPALATLADETNQDTETARKAVKLLRLAGMATCVPGSGRTSSAYILTIPDIEAETGTDIPLCRVQTYAAAGDVKRFREVQASRRWGMAVPPNLESTLNETLGGAPPRSANAAAGDAIDPAMMAAKAGAIAHRLGQPGQELLDKLGPEKIATWFETARVKDGKLLVARPFQANWIDTHFREEINRAWQQPIHVAAEAA